MLLCKLHKQQSHGVGGESLAVKILTAGKIQKLPEKHLTAAVGNAAIFGDSYFKAFCHAALIYFKGHNGLEVRPQIGQSAVGGGVSEMLLIGWEQDIFALGNGIFLSARCYVQRALGHQDKYAAVKCAPLVCKGLTAYKISAGKKTKLR